MQPRIRRLTALLGTAALVGGGGLGVARAADPGSTSGKPAQSAKRHHRGPSSAELSRLASKLGVTTARLRAAMQATRPAKPTGRRPDRGAALAAELGVDTAAVKEILDDNRPSRPARGTPSDHTALAAALAEGLNLDEAVVTAALGKIEAARRAEHDARHAAMAAALAKELGLTTAQVQAAFESVRPRRP
jgi:hypothetical protein